MGEPYMLALEGQPSLHGNYAWMVYWANGGTSGEIAGKNNGKTSFSPSLGFSVKSKSY